MSILDTVRGFPRGARFYRADLHIHSFGSGGSHDVRDPTMTPDAIVRRAETEGLDVIAVTDHNEIGNVPAALVAATGKLLLVPGVELSTAQGHVLCYTPTVDALQRFYGRLDFADRGTPDSRCNTSLVQCLTLLDEVGGFAVLAHVDAGGGFEDFEPNFSARKADVLCHRALLGIELKLATSDITYAAGDPNPDRARIGQMRIDKLGLGNKYALSRVLNSDAHSLNALGHNASGARRLTRVKMDSPSFPALCLAFEDGDARIRIEDHIPKSIPGVLGLHFEGGFLDGQTFHFSRNLNCIIGGRGTGKSTTFEAVRCISPAGTSSDLVDSDIWPAKLHVLWHDVADQVHTLCRDFGRDVENQDDPFEGPATFEIDCFGQGDTARISQKAKSDPLALVEYLDRFTNARPTVIEEQNLCHQLKELDAQIRTLEQQVSQIPQVENTIKVVARQLVALEKADAKGVIDLQRKLASEQSLRDQIIVQLRELKKFSDASAPSASHLLKTFASGGVTVGKAEFDDIVSDVSGFEASASATRSTLQSQWTGLNAKVATKLDAWKAKAATSAAAIEAKRKELEQQGIRLDLNTSQRLANDEARHQKTLQELKGKADELKSVKKDRDALLKARWLARGKTATRRTAYASAANHVLGSDLGDLKVSLKYAEHALSPEADDLIVATMGWRTNQVPRSSLLTQTLTVPKLIDAIGNNDPSQIAALKYSGGVQAFTSKEALDLIDRLRAVKPQLEVCAIHDLPRLNVTKRIEEAGVLKYKTRDFAKLSLGQQQSVLLALMLSADTDTPLIIDQPEDNLDGEFIFHTLVPVLRRAKERRQVIIVTHNANIAVLGDAELLFVLKSGNERGTVVARGSIDEPSTRDEACNILEGAKEAFRRRAQTYGFNLR